MPSTTTGCAQLGPQIAAQLSAVHVRHHPVADHHVCADRVVYLECFEAVSGTARHMSEVLDDVDDKGPDIRVVLRD